MNRQHAEAWDEVAAYAHGQGGTLVRDGHQFSYQWRRGARSVAVWADADAPRFGLRFRSPALERGELSVKLHSMVALVTVLHALEATA